MLASMDANLISPFLAQASPGRFVRQILFYLPRAADCQAAVLASMTLSRDDWQSGTGGREGCHEVIAPLADVA